MRLILYNIAKTLKCFMLTFIINVTDTQYHTGVFLRFRMATKWTRGREENNSKVHWIRFIWCEVSNFSINQTTGADFKWPLSVILHQLNGKHYIIHLICAPTKSDLYRKRPKKFNDSGACWMMTFYVLNFMYCLPKKDFIYNMWLPPYNYNFMLDIMHRQTKFYCVAWRTIEPSTTSMSHRIIQASSFFLAPFHPFAIVTSLISSLFYLQVARIFITLSSCSKIITRKQS